MIYRRRARTLEGERDELQHTLGTVRAALLQGGQTHAGRCRAALRALGEPYPDTEGAAPVSHADHVAVVRQLGDVIGERESALEQLARATVQVTDLKTLVSEMLDDHRHVIGDPLLREKMARWTKRAGIEAP